MKEREITYCDAEQAYRDGSYKLVSDEELEAFANACLNVSGVNQVNVDRVRRVGDLLRQELMARRELRAEQYTLEGMDQSDDPLSSVEEQNRTRLWTEQRLHGLIDDRLEESLQLEYKAAASLSRNGRDVTEITKDVSAFANSAGGTIIYGISEFRDEERQHLPERIDPVSRAQIPREWLEHILSSIRPRIAGLRIHPVQLSASEDSVAYVIEIPQGVTAHQAADLRYYRRYNFQSVPMPDHEVRDVMSRKVHPRIKVTVRLVLFQNPVRQDEMDGNLIFEIENRSDVFARYVALVVEAPLLLKGRVVWFEDGILLRNPRTGWLLRHSNHSGAPLFPRIKLTRHFKFRFASWREKELPPNQIVTIRYAAYADSMPKVEGEVEPATLLPDGQCD